MRKYTTHDYVDATRRPIRRQGEVRPAFTTQAADAWMSDSAHRGTP